MPPCTGMLAPHTPLRPGGGGDRDAGLGAHPQHRGDVGGSRRADHAAAGVTGVPSWSQIIASGHQSRSRWPRPRALVDGADPAHTFEHRGRHLGDRAAKRAHRRTLMPGHHRSSLLAGIPGSLTLTTWSPRSSATDARRRRL